MAQLIPGACDQRYTAGAILLGGVTLARPDGRFVRKRFTLRITSKARARDSRFLGIWVVNASETRRQGPSPRPSFRSIALESGSVRSNISPLVLDAL